MQSHGEYTGEEVHVRGRMYIDRVQWTRDGPTRRTADNQASADTALGWIRRALATS